MIFQGESEPPVPPLDLQMVLHLDRMSRSCGWDKQVTRKGKGNVVQLFANEAACLNSYLGENLHRESYMSAHVLLNLLNNLGKSDKMRGLHFSNESDKFNNTGPPMLDSIYHMKLKFDFNLIFFLGEGGGGGGVCMKTSRFCHTLLCDIVMGVLS